MTQAALEYINSNLYRMAKHYSAEIQANLLSGIALALENTQVKTHQISKKEILAIFDAMHPTERANMKFPTRKRSVSFLSTPDQRHHLSAMGLTELFDWCEKHQSEYGPRIEIINHFRVPRHFKTMADMRRFYDCENNADLAELMEETLKTKNSLHDTLRYIPIFDSLDPFIDKKTIKAEELEMLEGMDFSDYPVTNDVDLKFDELLNQINQKPALSILDIAQFIKDMMLLHPFPDGNSRTFTLAVVNQLLLKNNFGICLTIGEQVPFLTVADIATNIRKNLVSVQTMNKKDEVKTALIPEVVNHSQASWQVAANFLKKGLSLFSNKSKSENDKQDTNIRLHL